MKSSKFRTPVLLLLCLTVLLAACRKQEPEEPAPEPAAPVSLSGYGLVRPQLTSDSVTARASDLYEALLDVVGGDPSFSTDFLPDGEQADPNAKEILIGHTNRSETAQVLAQLQPGEYAAALVGSKLVLVGYTERFTPMAVEYFLSAYLGEGADGSIPGDLFYRGQADSVTLVSAGVPQYALVRAQYATDTAMDCLYRIADALEGAGSEPVTVRTDASAGQNASEPEILVGHTSYAAFDSLKDSCPPDTYGVYYVEGKIILFGWTDEDLILATDRFLDSLKYASYTDAQGKVSLCYPRENLVESNDAGYYMDVPTSAGGDYYDGVFNCSDGVMQLWWQNADESIFGAYGQELEAMGYSVWQQNAGSSVLAATYRRESTQVHIYYLKHLSEFRVSTQQDAVFPVFPESYDKVCEVSVTQLGLDYTVSGSVGGMGYVILLEDGSFAVIDGGYGGSDTQILWDTLNALKPAGVEEIVIRAWFLTHGHNDHYGTLRDFVSSYLDQVTVSYLIGNDPSDFLYSLSDQPKRSFSFESVNGKFGGCRYVKAHTGQSFALPGVTFSILYTQEDTSTSEPFEKFNSMSMVFDAVTNGERYIWFGDTEREGAMRIKSMYYEDLKCDVMQIAHHGVNGGSADLYRLCSPSVAFWPASRELCDSYAALEQNRYLTDTCERVIYAYAGTQTISYAETPDFGELEGAVQPDDPYSKFY